MNSDLAINTVQFFGTISFVFVLLNLLWILKHKKTFEIHTIVISSILVFYQGIHFLLQAFQAELLINSDLDDHLVVIYFVSIDLIMMLLATINSFYNCKVRIKL